MLETHERTHMMTGEAVSRAVFLVTYRLEYNFAG